MNAHTLRKWSTIKIFMYLLLAFCSLLVFWCQGASAMHLTPLDLSSFNLEHRRRHHPPDIPATEISSASQNHFVSLIRNSTNNQHYQQQASPINLQKHHSNEDLRLQKLWQRRMREKRARIQSHRKQKLILQQLLNQRGVDPHNSNHKITVENLKLSANPNLNINNLKHLINHNILTQHNHHFDNKLNYKINNTLQDDDHNHHRREGLYETLNEIMANISVTSNRNRRESRFHHQHQQQSQMSSSLSQPHNSNNINNNHNRSNNNRDRQQRRRRYCSARDPKTLAFEAPTVFEGKIKSMTPDRQANFSVTVEILRVHKQQTNFTLPRQVRLQFAYKNASECDIYREEFRHRGFVRDELEQGKIYFLFVKQISLGNFTILGQPIKKISRTAKDVEIGVSEKYGKRASIESLSPNLTVKEGKRVRIVCKVDGEPAPKVTWFKDGRSINRNRTKYIFVHLRRRSDLIIKSAVWNDSGKYECRAKNKLTLRRPVSNFTWLDVLSKHSPTTERTIKPLNEGMKECPAGGQSFCLNGGKCMFIESLKEPSCNCPEGFSGKNCEDKTPNITANLDFADPFLLHPPVASEYDDDDN